MSTQGPGVLLSPKGQLGIWAWGQVAQSPKSNCVREQFKRVWQVPSPNLDSRTQSPKQFSTSPSAHLPWAKDAAIHNATKRKRGMMSSVDHAAIGFYHGRCSGASANRVERKSDSITTTNGIPGRTRQNRDHFHQDPSTLGPPRPIDPGSTKTHRPWEYPWTAWPWWIADIGNFARAYIRKCSLVYRRRRVDYRLGSFSGGFEATSRARVIIRTGIGHEGVVFCFHWHL